MNRCPECQSELDSQGKPGSGDKLVKFKMYCPDRNCNVYSVLTCGCISFLEGEGRECSMHIGNFAGISE